MVRKGGFVLVESFPALAAAQAIRVRWAVPKEAGFRMSAATSSPIIAAAGGSFLLETRTPAEVFTPEDLNEEQRQIASTAAQFARDEILPAAAAIEAKQPGVLAALMRKAGELGFASVDIPEEYGGMGMDKTTSTLITDHLSVLASFSTAFGAHIGISTLPLVWYGTEEQKQRYLPRLGSGEWIGSYGLSEASSGSDAMNIRTRATLSADGSTYTLNGEKQWITNCGIASLYTVFAKIDGEKFSAFLIERDTPGLTVGAEEHKLGIHGSSTCPLVLDGCKIPAGNLLGEAGKGHHIAFNVLNVGRYKLGVACIGGARHALGHMIRYAKARKAFGKAIAEFGLIQRKISSSATQLFAAESMAYRTVGMIDAALAQLSPDQAHSPREIQRRIEEYAVECSILKVYGSEMLTLVADELLAREAEVLAAAKKMALFAAGVASQRFMTALQDEQEVMADLADIIMQVYGLESALLRARKLAVSGKGSGEAAAAMTGLLAYETIALADQAARRVLAACGEGDLLRTQLAILRRLAWFTL